MKNLFNNSIAVPLVLTLILVSGVFWYTSDAPKAGSVGGNPTVIGAATTSSAVSVTTSTRILATTTNALGTGTSYTRKYAQVCNPSSVKVLINLNNDVAADGRTTGGYWIDANSCFEITDRNIYNGSIQASTSDQTAVKVLVSDYVE